jgi:hypothetical protein
MYSFNRGYGLSHDDNYLSSEASSVDVMLDRPIESTGTSIREVGTSANPFEHQTKALLARIREGASRVEFAFMGAGKGNKQSFTPESFGTIERQEMRDLAKLNEIETSTHASPNTGPLSGFGQKGFDEQQRSSVVKEIKKAIDFAGDATTGGAVVFHTGEWQRPIEPFYGSKENKFRSYGSDQVIEMKTGRVLPEEERRKITPDKIDGKEYKYLSESDKAPLILADDETGQIQTISRDMKFYQPLIDEEATKEVRDKTKDNSLEVYQIETEGADKGQVKIGEFSFNEVYNDIKKRAQEEGRKELLYRDDGTDKTPEEVVLQAYLDQEISQSKGDALRWTADVPEYTKAYQELPKKVEVAKIQYEEIKRNQFPPEIQERMKEEAKEAGMDFNDYLDIQIRRQMPEDPTAPGYRRTSMAEYLDEDSLKQLRESYLIQIRSGQSTGSAYMQRAKQSERQLKHMKPIEDVGIWRTADTISDAAMHAIEVTKKNKDHLKNDIYVAPESYDPNLYGGHPDEIRNIIQKSRERLVEKLTRNNHYKKEEAEKLAANHIKGTLDIGHLNMWRQFMVRKDNESMEDFDKRFNKWVLDETEKLAKEGYVGHAHISDNFGYDDEHLIAGEGNAPVAEFMRRMKKHGVNEFIQEPGSFNFDYALRQTWRNMGVGNFDGSGAYRASAGRALPGRVDQFLNSYFGHTAKPSYVFGKYMPKVPNVEKSWAPWSGTPL